MHLPDQPKAKTKRKGGRQSRRTCGVQHAAPRLLQHEHPRAEVPAAAQPQLVKHVQPAEEEGPPQR